MIDPLLSAGALAISSDASAPSQSALATTDVERFRTALNAPAAEGLATSAQAAWASDPSLVTTTNGPVAQAPSGSGAEAGEAPQKPRTLGEAILQSMQGARDGLASAWNSADAVANSPQLAPGDLLKMQMALLQVGIQYDLTSKLISKSTQNLEQIIKTQ